MQRKGGEITTGAVVISHGSGAEVLATVVVISHGCGPSEQPN